MSYQKKTWQAGEVIKSMYLNNIENGIETLDTNLANTMRVSSQDLTESQKTQARLNIDAVKAQEDNDNDGIILTLQ